MEFLGVILADPPGIDLRRWKDLIRHHPNFVQLPPHEFIGPTTKQRRVIPPLPIWSALRVVAGGNDAGFIQLASEGSGEIEIFGERSLMIPLAHDIANSLDGRFEEWSLGQQLSVARHALVVKCFLMEANDLLRRLQTQQQERDGQLAKTLSWIYPQRRESKGDESGDNPTGTS